MEEKGKRILSVLLLLVAAAAGWLALQRQGAQTAYTKNIFAMDTIFTLRAYGPKAEEALKAAESRTRELERLFSVKEEGSDIRRINHASRETNGILQEIDENAQEIDGAAQEIDGAAQEIDENAQEIDGAAGEIAVSPDTMSVLQTALRLGGETEGALDVTIYPVLREWGFTTEHFQIPSEERLRELVKKVDYRQLETDGESLTVRVPEGVELDLGALAKGYTGDCLIQLLREAGVRSAILDLGGNVQTLGVRPDGSLWQVAVKNPFDPGEELGVLRVADKAVITSGSYERFFVGEDGRKYWHILDPADGYPADSGLVSVTVVGEGGVTCDGLSTALFVMGRERAAAFWREKRDFEMILVTEEGELSVTEGLADCFQAGNGWEAEVIFR